MRRVVVFFLLGLLAMSCKAQKNQELALFFFDTCQEELAICNRPFYVTYQLLGALQQKQGTIVASAHLLKNIYKRAKRFERLVKKPGLYADVQKLHLSVTDALKRNMSLFAINEIYTLAWTKKNTLYFSKASNHDAAQVQFDYACFLLLSHIVQYWKFFQVSDDIVVCSLKKLPYKQRYLSQVVAPKKNVASQNMSEIFEWMSLYNNTWWSLYIVGHGHIGENLEKSYLCGLSVESMQAFLSGLNHYFVNVCAYNSCYSGGILGALPLLKTNGAYNYFSYPIVILSLLPAPTYVFGEPSALHLPPYTSDHKLDDAHCAGVRLRYMFPQQFKKFWNFAKQHRFTTELAHTLNTALQCDQSGSICQINAVESLPQILWPGAQQLELLADTQNLLRNYIMLNTQNADDVYIDAKTQGILPSISGNWWYHVHSVTTEQSIVELPHLLFSLQDLQTHFVLHIDRLIAKKQILTNVLLFHKAPFVPRFLQRKMKSGFGIYYEINGNAYFVPCLQEAGIYKKNRITQEQKKDIAAYISLLHSHITKDTVPDVSKLMHQFDLAHQACSSSKLCAENVAYHTEHHLLQQLV